jgi:hypothetical protein
LRGCRIFRVSSCCVCECLLRCLSIGAAQFCNQVFGFLFDLGIQILPRDFQKNLLDLDAGFLEWRLQAVELLL